VTNIALVDDHVMLRNGLATLINSIGFNVLFEANNGEDCIRYILTGKIPTVILMDINMPAKDGYETTLWLKQNYPEIRVLALTMVDDENAVIRMLKNGARGYLLKESGPAELKTAIYAVAEKGFYYSEMVTGRLVHSITVEDEESKATHQVVQLTEKEIYFLKLVCTDLTYKEIAAKMKLSPRTVDSYRDHLFHKLNIKTRTSLAIYAIKNGIVKL
jgi:two-component system invasion response regulator UvrY